MIALELRDEPYDGAIAQALIAAVQLEYVARYGGPDDTPVDPMEFAPPGGLFLIGYVDGHAAAMGGLRRHVNHERADLEFEIKRMYVVPEMRGRGLSRVMLAALEDRARGLAARRIVLETGDRQPEAISLYRSSGYLEIPGFGYYADGELSISFEKKLV